MCQALFSEREATPRNTLEALLPQPPGRAHGCEASPRALFSLLPAPVLVSTPWPKPRILRQAASPILEFENLAPLGEIQALLLHPIERLNSLCQLLPTLAGLVTAEPVHVWH